MGQKYTIRRNGEVINEFENTPGQESSRGGDPSTTLRQFTQGYIGLQNHSDADKMQYRNVRVEDLSPGAPGLVAPKPFTVSGKGPHTIEVRSTDAAGHVEPKQTLAFEIGAQVPEGPTQTVPLVPQAPVSPIIPPMTRAHRDGEARDDLVEDHARDVRQEGRRGADRLHRRDGRLGEADGRLLGGQAAQAEPGRRWPPRTPSATARTRSR